MSKLKKLREVMKKYNINYYIIPSADPHQSEYVAEYYRGRAEVSGFTGSAGTLLVGEKEAKLWVNEFNDPTKDISYKQQSNYKVVELI